MKKPSKRMGLLVAATLLLAAGAARKQTYVKIPSFGGTALTADNKTLIVSLSSAATLAYYDTMTDKEIKEIRMPGWAPTCSRGTKYQRKR